MFRVVITQRAMNDLSTLDNSIQKRILSKLKEFSNDPLKYSIKLTNPIIGNYRFRIGDYRVVFDIDNHIVIVLRIGHRKDIYQ